MVDSSVSLNLRSPLVKTRLRADFFTGLGIGPVDHKFSCDYWIGSDSRTHFMLQPVVKHLRLSCRGSWRPPAHGDSRNELKGWPSGHTIGARHLYAHQFPTAFWIVLSNSARERV